MWPNEPNQSDPNLTWILSLRVNLTQLNPILEPEGPTWPNWTRFLNPEGWPDRLLYPHFTFIFLSFNSWWCRIWTLPRMAMLVLWKLWRFKCSNPKFRSSLHKDKENNINSVSQKMTMAESWASQGLTRSCVIVMCSIKVEYWIPNKSFFAGELESSMYKKFTL